MHYGNFTLFVEMRMGVCIRRLAMGCPSGMRDARGTCYRALFDPVFQIAKASFRLADLQSAALICHSNARAIIAAVFQPSQAL